MRHRLTDAAHAQPSNKPAALQDGPMDKVLRWVDRGVWRLPLALTLLNGSIAAIGLVVLLR
jgi:hypothetical protein